ncbi:hypothetical protein B0H63DRAFT_471002 [Podospora didyma]|uniref:Uncharacterized protein n=1 Tax=Podospora didyma TaxID=330526 RepID=A0AAE0NU96_9PEZI|nr:hypothetical protein B0H63DRAFT_471002 [Podospora didyma]
MASSTQLTESPTSLAYDSQNISFSQWISLLTLCLAPVFVHILSGAPEPTYLTPKDHGPRPKWHDRICHYAPPSIIWRYAAITDRRIRAVEWNAADMAAANAIFWTSYGWDGSETMAVESVRYLIAPPDSARMTVLSWEFIKTVLTTLQGGQAIFVFAANWARITTTRSVPLIPAVDRIFHPLAALGLCRLYAAFWLTSDFAYFAPRGDNATTSATPFRNTQVIMVPLPTQATTSQDEDTPSKSQQIYRQDSKQISPPSSDIPAMDLLTAGPYLPSSYLPSRLFRALYLAPMFLLVPFISLAFFSPWRVRGTSTTATASGGASGGAFYVGGEYSITMILMMASSMTGVLTNVVIYAYYAARVGCNSTIIPCIAKTWYKVLCCVYFAGSVMILVCAAIQTRRTPCGSYTTTAPEYDFRHCPGLVSVGSSGTGTGTGLGTTVAFGLAMESASLGTTAGGFTVANFTGSCQGSMGLSEGAVFTT